jgi:tetratricopeptide (TPR) repeat protein
MTLDYSVTKNPVEEAKLNTALEALEAARELQRMRRSHGVNRIELLVDDVDGDWLEQWGEDEVLDSEEFQEKLDFFVAIARREELQKDIQKIEEKIFEADREIQDFKAKFINKIQRAYQDLPAAIPVQLSSRESPENFPELPLSLAKNIELITSLSDLVSFYPTSEDYFRLGNACFLEGRYEEAVTNYDRSVELNSELPEAWSNRGLSLKNLERYEESIANYDKAIELTPDFSSAWYNRGISLDILERHEEAIISYEKAIELAPENYEVWNNRGVSLDKLGHHEKAIASFDQAFNLKPDFYQVLINKGIALAKWRRYEDALASHEKALDLRPGYANAWFNKACVYALQGDVDQTLENLAQAIQLDPMHREQAKTDSDFDLARSDARFKKLLEE